MLLYNGNVISARSVEVHVKKLLKCVHALQQEVKSHFDCIITLQEDRNKNEANISNTIETFNLKIETSAKEVLRLSTDLKTLEPRVCSPYFCQIYLKTDKVFAAGSIISTFQSVMERNGSHFNQTTGKLVAPDDRCYLVIVTLQESDGRLISVRVCVEGNSKKSVFVTSAVCVSTIVDMKKGEKLYFELILAEVRAKLQTSSGFTIVSL
ncbi:uncharacterized protein LOC131947398 isoform X2 [Physella acuta]|uniref:uncharacterized protein LOC131947398 isoform X2 n=1 Tax=Physella acuta TaxID=109671 RepID=UPI0027DBD182|nr:uncharacterized protein LOC131947398 isoform X2 [Physella acuta]